MSTIFFATRRRMRVGSFLALLLVAVATGCTMNRRPAPPAAVFPSGAAFRLEIAADETSRARGYMFRDVVGPDEGMLFVFDRSDRYPFWMKNCKVSLDIIWLDADHRVVEIAHDQPPCAPEGPCPNIFPMRAARYVLEVAGGTARREGLARGARVEVFLREAGPS